jgi:hypothetical protein
MLCITAVLQSTAQPCTGSWALQLPLTVECVSGQWIGWQTGPVNPPGCPINPVYVGVQSNTFTFTQPVSTFSIDFRDFDGTIQCPRMEIKINGSFYPLTIANLIDIPGPSTCTGSFSSLAISADGYVTVGSFSPASGQGRIIIYNVNANSVTISTNDGNGTIFSNPFGCTTVPLKLESFIGQSNNCKATLNWKTGIEFNVKNIEIERSEDGNNFIKVGSVSPKGSDSRYLFVADNTTSAFFRLKINDLDGYFEYSEIIYVKSSCNENSYSITPNPASDEIKITGLKNSDQVLILDMLGKVVMRFNAPVNNKLNIQSISPGMYILQVFNSGIPTASLKLIKY